MDSGLVKSSLTQSLRFPGLRYLLSDCSGPGSLFGALLTSSNWLVIATPDGGNHPLSWMRKLRLRPVKCLNQPVSPKCRHFPLYWAASAGPAGVLGFTRVKHKSMVGAPDESREDQTRSPENHAKDSPTIAGGECTSFRTSPKGCLALAIILVLMFKNNTCLLENLETYKENKSHLYWLCGLLVLFSVWICANVYIDTCIPI